MAAATARAGAGIVLAGGGARRMGGGDKALRPLGGRPLLAHVVAALQPQCETLVLSANGDPCRFAAFGLPVVADTAGAGPLAGILAGLDAAATLRGTDEFLALVAPTDCPLLPDDLGARLLAAMKAGSAEIALAASGGRVHPVIGLWKASLRHSLRRALTVDGIRKVEAFTAGHATAVATWDSQPFDPFFNINTPGDLENAERLVAGGHPTGPNPEPDESG